MCVHQMVKINKNCCLHEKPELVFQKEDILLAEIRSSFLNSFPYDKLTYLTVQALNHSKLP